MNHSANPTKPNKTAKAMPTAKCIPPPPTVLIPDEVPFEPADPELVDVAPDAVPDPEGDELELEVERIFGSRVMLTHVPPILFYFNFFKKNGEFLDLFNKGFKTKVILPLSVVFSS